MQKPMITVYLSDNSPSTIKLIDSFKPFEANNVLFLTMDSMTYLYLRGHGYPVKYAHELIRDEDRAPLLKGIISAIHGAYADPTHPYKRDFSAFDALPLGYFSEFYLMPIMRRILTQLNAVRRCAEMYADAERIIVIGEDDFARMARMVLTQRGMRFEAWKSGRIRRMALIAPTWWQGRKNQWLNTIARNTFFETIQTLIAIVLFGILPAKKRLSGKPVLVFSANRNMMPIVEMFRASGTMELAIFGIDFRLRMKDFKDAYPLEQGIDLRCITRTLHAWGYYILQWFRVNDNPEFTDKFNFMGISYWSAVAPAIKWDLFITFPKLLLYSKIVSNSFKRMPQGSLLILTSSEHPIDRISIDAAKRNGIATVGTQHGYFDEDSIGRGLLPDYHVSWGDSVREFQLKSGNKVANIFVTGSPRYDGMFHRAALHNRDRILTDLKLPSNRRIITLVTVWGETVECDDDIFAVDATVGAINELGLRDSVHLVVKPHPTADIAIIETAVRQAKEKFDHISLIKGNIEELYFISDIVVGQYSTALLEAMFFSKPSIVFTRFAEKEWVPYVSRGAALKASNTAEMTTALRSLLFDKDARQRIIDAQPEFIRYAAYKFDGQSTERFCRAIELLSEGKTPPNYL